jgi:hypothetical protein
LVISLLVNVHLTGGKAFWQELTGPALLAITAIAAAAIAARTANTRQREQLAHDRALQERQLAHDREQRDRQHIRDTIDGAVRGADEAVHMIARFRADVLVNGDRNPRTEKESAELHADRDTSYDTYIKLFSENIRLGVRLGLGHPIVGRHDGLIETFVANRDLLSSVFRGPLVERDIAEIGMQSEFLADGVGRFLEECEGWFEASASQVVH